jgi:hypothetical protein
VFKKVLRHFPLIPRLKRMFRAPNLSELMKWHQSNRSIDGLIWHAPNSRHGFTLIQHGQNLFTFDSTSPRNLRLGLALDGVNPLGN